MLYPLYFIGAIFFTVLCYLTNWLVVLFMDTKTGELPGFLRYWSTWDDSLIGHFQVSCAPKFLQYDVDSKYEEYLGTTEELEKLGRKRWFARMKEGATFTFVEKLKRYACAVLWLYRNNSYGFCFYLLGKDVTGTDLVYTAKEDKYYVAYESTKSIWNRAWIYKNERKIFDKVSWNIFMGWKIDESSTKPTRAMVAIRILAFSID